MGVFSSRKDRSVFDVVVLLKLDLAAVWVAPRQITHVNTVTLYGNPTSLPSRVTLFQNGNLGSNPCNTHQIPNELFWVTHVR